MSCGLTSKVVTNTTCLLQNINNKKYIRVKWVNICTVDLKHTSHHIAKKSHMLHVGEILPTFPLECGHSSLRVGK